MVKTNTQRQAEYQRRQSEAGNRRLDLFISADAQEALERLAEREGDTRRNVIENLLINGANKMTSDELRDLLDFKEQLPSLMIVHEQVIRADAFNGGKEGAKAKEAFNAALNASNIHRK